MNFDERFARHCPSVLTTVDSVGLLVGDLNAELLLTDSLIECSSGKSPAKPYLLNSHHNLNSIQGIQTEVVREVGRAVDLFTLNFAHMTNICSLQSLKLEGVAGP